MRFFSFGCLMLILGVTIRSYDTYLKGNPADAQAKTRPGTVLMGGGKDVDEAFRWMIDRSGGGDFLILRASGKDGYNDYIAGLGEVDSVETVVFNQRSASFEQKVVDKIDQAEAIFLAGGDQSKYIKFWRDTPVQAALQRAIDRGAPIGGTSAGLAVLGNPLFAAHKDTVTSEEVLKDPYHVRVTLESRFLEVPGLDNLVTDTHFSQRERMGRLVTFMARSGENVRGLGVDEATALLLEPDGKGRVVGKHEVYFVTPAEPPRVLQEGQPLTYENLQVLKLGPGQEVHLNEPVSGATRLDVIQGKLKS